MYSSTNPMRRKMWSKKGSDSIREEDHDLSINNLFLTNNEDIIGAPKKRNKICPIKNVNFSNIAIAILNNSLLLPI